MSDTIDHNFFLKNHVHWKLFIFIKFVYLNFVSLIVLNISRITIKNNNSFAPSFQVIRLFVKLYIQNFQNWLWEAFLQKNALKCVSKFHKKLAYSIRILNSFIIKKKRAEKNLKMVIFTKAFCLKYFFLISISRIVGQINQIHLHLVA